MSSYNALTAISIFAILISTVLALPQGQFPPLGTINDTASTGLQCPSTSATICAGASGLTTILITCTNGAPSSSDCLEHGANIRCYASSATDATCSEAPADAPALPLLPLVSGAARPTDHLGDLYASYASASSTSGTLDETDSPISSPTESPSRQRGDGYAYASGYAQPTGAPFPPRKPRQSTLDSSWNPQPTQSTAPSQSVGSSPSSSGSSSPTSAFMANQSSDSVSRRGGCLSVILAAAMMACMAS